MKEKTEKDLLLRLTKKDFITETFRAGGKGGQHQNKTDSGYRIKHPQSGAVGESREFKSQTSNKKAAFKRLINSKEFKKWLNWEIAKILEVNTYVEHELKHNVMTEVKEEGKWRRLT